MFGVTARTRRAAAFATVSTAAVMLVLGGLSEVAGASESVIRKVTLTVAVTGTGGVISKPAGISCPNACKLQVPRDTRVVLIAQAAAGSVLSHWAAPCGTTKTCTLTMSKSTSAHAFFKTEATTTTTTTTTPPPPVAKPGHYVGTYSDGSVLNFDVQGSSLTNLTFDFNGHCSDGGDLSGPPTPIRGSFPIQSDGSVSGHITLTYSNASGSADFSGKLTAGGSGTGNLSVSITFNNGGPTCTSNGTWTAQDQS